MLFSITFLILLSNHILIELQKWWGFKPKRNIWCNKNRLIEWLCLVISLIVMQWVGFFHLYYSIWMIKRFFATLITLCNVTVTSKSGWAGIVTFGARSTFQNFVTFPILFKRFLKWSFISALSIAWSIALTASGWETQVIRHISTSFGSYLFGNHFFH